MQTRRIIPMFFPSNIHPLLGAVVRAGQPVTLRKPPNQDNRYTACACGKLAKNGKCHTCTLEGK